MVPKPKGVNERSSRNRDDLRWIDCGYYLWSEVATLPAFASRSGELATATGATQATGHALPQL